MSTQNLPTSWDSADQLEGYDLHDKATLIDHPFRIFGVEIRTNKNNVQMAVLSVERLDGDRVQFQDSSSTGVCAQMKDYLTSKGHGDAIDSGEHVAVNLVSPRGLRVSDYFRTVRGREVSVQSYYLTSAGMELTPEPVAAAPEKAPAARKPAARKTAR